MRAQSLIATDVVKFFGERRVLDAVNLTANPGQRLGLVGENGAGKSTLLRLLAGADTPDAGQISRPADTGLLHQELPFTAGQTVGDVIADALRESRQLLHRLDQLLHQPDRLDEYAQVLQRAEQIDAWDADRRADEVMHGLGLPAIGRNRTLGTLSGGQRSRVALARPARQPPHRTAARRTHQPPRRPSRRLRRKPAAPPTRRRDRRQPRPRLPRRGLHRHHRPRPLP